MMNGEIGDKPINASVLCSLVTVVRTCERRLKAVLITGTYLKSSSRRVPTAIFFALHDITFWWKLKGRRGERTKTTIKKATAREAIGQGEIERDETGQLSRAGREEGLKGMYQWPEYTGARRHNLWISSREALAREFLTGLALRSLSPFRSCLLSEFLFLLVTRIHVIACVYFRFSFIR